MRGIEAAFIVKVEYADTRILDGGLSVACQNLEWIFGGPG